MSREIEFLKALAALEREIVAEIRAMRRAFVDGSDLKGVEFIGPLETRPTSAPWGEASFPAPGGVAEQNIPVSILDSASAPVSSASAVPGKVVIGECGPVHTGESG